MNFILIDGEICVVTHCTCDEDIETQQVSSMSSIKSQTVTVGKSITGEMLVFRQGSLPTIFRDDGIVKKMTMEFARQGKLYTLDDVIVTSRRTMPNAYDKCEAAYFEYAATDIQIDKMIAETIKVGSTK